MKREKVFLTIGITAHAEGVIAHKTIQGVLAGLDNLDVEKYPYEIIVHIDNGDEATIGYFKRYEKDKRFKIIYSHFGDLGLSRNCIVQHARGRYVSFLDADDILSSNWYANAIDLMEKSEDIIMIHPNIQFNFGAGTRLEFTIRKDSYDRFEDAIISAGVNRWCSAIMGSKETFLKYPYMETKNGYGYEDYNLNTNTVSHGIKHMVAPETVMFYRQKAEGSLLASSNTEHVIQPYTPLLDIDYIKSVPKSEIDKMRPRTIESRRRSGMLKIYYAVRGNRYANFFITPVAKVTKKILGIVPAEERRGGAKIPDFMMREWKKVNRIESQLYPTEQALAEIFQAEPDDYSVGLAYYDLVKDIPKIPDYVFIVPWVRIGGADKVLANYIKAIKYHHPDWVVAVITTLPGKNDGNTLPNNAYLIDFGNRANSIWPVQREILFSRLIAQLRCKRIHIINSEYGYRWVASHKKFMIMENELAVSIFSMTNQYNPAVGSYANPYLVDIYGTVKKIYSDNENMLRELENREGFSMEKMRVVYQPVEQLVCRDNKESRNKKNRILWASRIDREKLPEILPMIARHLDMSLYEICVYGEMSNSYDKKMFDGVEGIKYMGKYNDFAKICEEGYDMFLYTSNRDGMPNVVLEAAAAGLPIVASEIGGVPEFVVDKKTGLLVKNIEDPEEYAKKIRYLFKHKDEVSNFARNARKLLERRHSWEKFYDTTEDMFR